MNISPIPFHLLYSAYHNPGSGTTTVAQIISYWPCRTILPRSPWFPYSNRPLGSTRRRHEAWDWKVWVSKSKVRSFLAFCHSAPLTASTAKA